MAGVPLAVLALVIVLASPASASGQLRVDAAAQAYKAPTDAGKAASGLAARRALHRGYLVPNQRSYERRKARLNRRAHAERALTAPMSGSLAPKLVRGWQGINNVNVTPPDETSAVGTTRYIELVNTNFAIYGKTSNTPLSTGTINSLVGAPSSDDVFDVQVIWDPTTDRFYYAAADVVSPTDNRLAFGFSTTASPSSAADWCKVSISGFGATFPDYPKLGDSEFFAMIGSNLFNGNFFVGSHLLALSKPRSGDTCATYANTVKLGDRVLSSAAFTPVPANEIDSNATGWAVATSSALPSSRLHLFKVTRNPNGSPNIASTPTDVTVPRYSFPANAPQKSSANLIDTLDARNTQAVAAVDPAHNDRLALWTQHTINVGGGRAGVRWYELDPAARAVLQSGTASNPSLFAFNGAISPNRQVNGATSGGGAMVMNYNTSSPTTFPGISMVSKVADGAQSAPVAVKDGPAPVGGFDCDYVQRFCRWGDYAAATPDPSTANRIWQVSQFSASAGTPTGPATSRTWNFVADIDTAVSKPRVSAKRKQKQSGRRVKVKVKAGAREQVTATATGKVKVKKGKKKKAYRLKKKVGQVAGGAVKTLRLKLAKRKQNRKVLKAIDRGKKVRAPIAVELTDASGNSVTKSVVVKLK